jgi:hypothetical protein
MGLHQLKAVKGVIMAFCMECGPKLPQDAAFCPEYGTKTAGASPSQTAASAKTAAPPPPPPNPGQLGGAAETPACSGAPAQAVASAQAVAAQTVAAPASGTGYFLVPAGTEVKTKQALAQIGGAKGEKL